MVTEIIQNIISSLKMALFFVFMLEKELHLNGDLAECGPVGNNVKSSD